MFTICGFVKTQATQAFSRTRHGVGGWWKQLFEAAKPKDVEQTYPFFLLVFFLLTRVFFHLAGLRFDMANLEHSMHLADTYLLENDFLRTVWYEHVHPPLYNVMSGLLLKVSPEGYEGIVAQPLFLILGLLFMFGLYQLLLIFRVPPRLATLLTAIFIASPNTLYTENWYSYSYPLVVAILWSAVALYWWAAKGSKNWLFISFSCMAFAVGIHAFFQFAWLLLGFLTLFVLGHKRRFEILLCGLLPLLFAGGISYKNQLLYGTFASSTWTPLTLSLLTNTFHITPEERQALYESDMGYSKLILEPRPDLGFAAYPQEYRPASLTGIPVLDEEFKRNGDPNFNYYGQLNLMPDLKNDALLAMKTDPARYWGTVQDALFIFLLPTSDFFHLSGKTLTFYWDWSYNLITTGRLGWSPRPVVHHLQLQTDTYAEALPGSLIGMFKNTPWYLIGWLQFLIIPVLLGTGVYVTYKAWFPWSKREDFASRITLLYMLYVVSYVAAVSIFGAIMENQRYRYYCSAFLTLYLAYLLVWINARYRPQIDSRLKSLIKRNRTKGTAK